MIVVLKDNPDQKQLDNLVSWLKSMGLDIHFSKGETAVISRSSQAPAPSSQRSRYAWWPAK